MDKNFAKITNAVYRILDFLPEGDPLKNRSKDKVLAIVDSASVIFDTADWISVKKYLSPSRQKSLKQLLEDIEILEQYLVIGKNQGWIDSVNFLIITHEYEKIKSKAGFSKALFLEEKELVDMRVGEEATKVEDSVAEERLEVKEREEYSPRQQKILQVLEKNKQAQVADLIKELPKITKRTIRRDLDDLLKKDKIARIGEWNQVFYQIKR